MTRHWVFIAAAVVAGVLWPLGYWWVGLPLALWALIKTSSRHWPAVLLALVIGLAGGWQEAHLTAQPPVPQGPVTVMPTAWQVTGNLARYRGQAANGVMMSGSVTLTPSQAQVLQTLTEPAEVTWQKNPVRLSGARNLFEFDYANYAWAQSHLAYEAIKQPLVWRVRPARGVVEWLYGVRVGVLTRLAQLPPRTGRYAKGLLLGQVDEDFDALRSTFVDLGIFHLFSVSGLHLVALVGGLYWLTDRLKITKEAVDWALIIGLPSLLVLIPPGAGIVRAVGMRVLMAVNARLHWHLTPLDLLSITLLLNLLWQPRVLLTFGGQLTYLLAGVLVLLPKLSAFQLAWRLMLTSLPVVVAHTFRLHVLSGVFNWLLMPVFELAVMPLLLVVAVVPHTPVTPVLEWGLGLLENGLVALGQLPGQVVIGALAPWGALLGVVATLMLLAHRRVWPVVTWALVAFFSVRLQPTTRVVMFDIGQGDAFLVEAPHHGGTLLIDTGGQLFGQARNPKALRIIANYLYARGYSHLDALVLTHADADHVGDAAALTRVMPVTTLYTTPLAATHPLIQAARNGRVLTQKAVLTGARVQAGAIQLQVVAPSTNSATAKNADSLVLYGKIGDGFWLFTGDADASVEAQELVPKQLAADYLKVGHHGSRTSTSAALLDQIKPQVALISAGVANRYGHPHLETMVRLAVHRIPTWVTASSGMVWVEMTDTTHQIHQVLASKDTKHATE